MKSNSGFNLIELLVCLAIVGILASIAYPSYQHYLTRSYRVVAQQNLLILAKNSEQYRAKNKNYQGMTLADITTSMIQSDPHYQYQLPQVTEDSYQLAAMPQGAQATRDAGCGALLLSNLGVEKITGSKPISECWAN